MTVGDYGTVFEQDSMFPNENVTREVMQLFTLGNEKLNADGRFALVNCSTVSAYGSQDKLIARVFTGFRHRGVRRKHGDAVDKFV